MLSVFIFTIPLPPHYVLSLLTNCVPHSWSWSWCRLLLKCSSGHLIPTTTMVLLKVRKLTHISYQISFNDSMTLNNQSLFTAWRRFVNILMFSICNDFDIDLSLCSTGDGDSGPDNQFYPGSRTDASSMTIH